jgi:DNA-binding response OmpR family regulator
MAVAGRADDDAAEAPVCHASSTHGFVTIGGQLAPAAGWGLHLIPIGYYSDSGGFPGDLAVRSMGEGLKMPARKILVVDDDDILRDSLVEQLSLYEEFDIEQEANAAKGIQRVRNQPVDLVVMDVGLPDMDGREAVKLLRKGGFKAPVIMLTGQDTESDTILGLEAGANDYVTKPFRFAVLLARIRAQLRQHEQSEDAIFTIGGYSFRPSAKMLVDERGQKVRLTEKETAILKFLYRAGEKVITRDVLLHEVWGYNSGVTTHTLETHIYRLRQKIEQDPSKAELLVTDVGGYKLVP